MTVKARQEEQVRNGMVLGSLFVWGRLAACCGLRLLLLLESLDPPLDLRQRTTTRKA